MANDWPHNRPPAKRRRQSDPLPMTAHDERRFAHWYGGATPIQLYDCLVTRACIAARIGPAK
jgi:hypothetical protein